MRKHPFRVLFAITVLVALGVACQTQSANQPPSTESTPATTAGQKAEEVKDKVAAGAEKAGEAIKDAAQTVKEKAGPAAKAAGEDVKTYGKAAGDVIDAKKQTLDIKAALMADSNIDASTIEVSADSENDTITLRGTVPTEATKSAVEKIARQKAQGYTIHNQLTVTAKPAAR